jgi:hypothetical protein
VSSVAVPFKIVAILRPSVSASPIEPRMPAQSDFGRVSGIILSGGAHAIYVTTSGATVLQPGDRLPDAAGSKVQSIDADGITVSTTDGRLVRLALSD